MAVSGVGNNFNYMYGNTYAVQNHEKTEEDKIKNRIDKKEEMKETTHAQAGKQGYEQLSARNRAMGGTVTCYQQTWMIHEDGSIQSTVYSVTETGMTNAERMKKQMDERLEKQKEKKEEAKKAEDKKAENKKAEAQKRPGMRSQ